MNEESKSTSYWERPSKNVEVYDRGTEGIYKSGSDGKIVWEYFPVFTRLLEGDQLSDALKNRMFDGPDGPDVCYKTMKTEGIERINGKDCYKVVKIPEKGTERTVYYDRESFMIVKITAYNINPQETYKREVYFEEYQKIDNILFPYKTVYF
ncbi:MAG: hypothetical protein PVG39_20390 [Desulfobacteraceae bacterium]